LKQKKARALKLYELEPIMFSLYLKIEQQRKLGHEIVWNDGHRCRFCGIPLALLSVSGESCDSPQYQG
jgi:hypothetical protein